jgi:NAD(P)-dependent dehydrogenase (short-subunit alcohol dehydrogenase family)
VSSSVIIGGSGGLGRAIAQVFADRGDSVIVTSRDQTRADKAAAEIGPTARGAGADLTRPETLADALADAAKSTIWSSRPSTRLATASIRSASPTQSNPRPPNWSDTPKRFG